MQKIGQIPNSNPDSNGEWTEGNPASGALATILKSTWLNTVQRELASVVEGFGGELDPEDDAQLLQILQGLKTTLDGKANNVWKRAYKASPTSRAETTTLEGDPDLVIALDTGSTYRIEGFLRVNQETGNGGFKFAAINGDQSFDAGTYALLSAAGDGINDSRRISTSTVSYSWSGVLGPAIHFSGVIRTGAGLDKIWKIAWAQNSSDTEPTFLRDGCWILAEKLSP